MRCDLGAELRQQSAVRIQAKLPKPGARYSGAKNCLKYQVSTMLRELYSISDKGVPNVTINTVTTAYVLHRNNSRNVRLTCENGEGVFRLRALCPPAFNPHSGPPAKLYPLGFGNLELLIVAPSQHAHNRRLVKSLAMSIEFAFSLDHTKLPCGSLSDTSSEIVRFFS
jgi:hypothetical protein